MKLEILSGMMAFITISKRLVYQKYYEMIELEYYIGN